MITLNDLRYTAQLCTVGMHEHKPILLTLTAGRQIVFHSSKRKEGTLVPREAVASGKLPVGGCPQAQQTPATFQHRDFVFEFAGSQRIDNHIYTRY